MIRKYSIPIFILSFSLSAIATPKESGSVIDTVREYPKTCLAFTIAPFVVYNRGDYARGFRLGAINLPKQLGLSVLVGLVYFPLTGNGLLPKGIVGIDAAPKLLVDFDAAMVAGSTGLESVGYRAFLRTFLLEELPFRFVLQHLTMRALKSEAGLVMNAILFALIHTNNWGQIVVNAIASYYFGVTRVYHNYGLAASAGYHAANNLFFTSVATLMEWSRLKRDAR